MFIGGIYDKNKSKKEIGKAINIIKKINCFSAIKYKISKYSTKGFGVISIIPERLFAQQKLKEFKDLVIGFQGYILEKNVDGLYSKYKKLGGKFVEDLDGNFNIIIFNKNDKSLKIFNDRSAYFGIYYLGERNFIFGTNIKSILATSKKTELNKEAMIELFHLGHFLGDKTLFKSVKHLNQGSILNYKNNLKINPYWIPKFKMQNKSKKWFIKEFDKRIRNSVSKRVKNKEGVGLALSGGLDSRAIAAAIEREGYKIKAFSYGDKSTNDFRFGRQIANKLGFEHFPLEIKSIDLMQFIPFVIWQTEGNVPYDSCLSPIYHKQLLKKGIKYRFGGASGDICSGGHIQLYMLITKSKKDFLKKAIKNKEYISFENQKKIFNNIFLKNNLSKFRRRFINSFMELKEEKIANMNDIWDFKNRQQRFVFSANQVDRQLFSNVEPFLDKGLLELWLNVPIKYRFFQNYYKKAILRLNKKIKNVPWAHTSKKIPSTNIATIYYQGINYLSNKIKGLLCKFYFNKQAEMIDMRKVLLNNQEYKKELIYFVNSAYFPQEVFNKEGILVLVRDHYKNKIDNSRVLNMLMTLNYSLKYLFYLKGMPKEISKFVKGIANV